MRPFHFLSLVLLISLPVLLIPDTIAQDHSHPGFSERVDEREQMVTTGIENYPYQPVKDPLVLQAMRRVPRHLFIPLEYRDLAYRNSPLYIGYDQTIS